MGKKKSFIDKKNSSTFHLIHRSQRDVSQHLVAASAVGGDDDGEKDETPDEFVLWPSPHNNPLTNRAVLHLDKKKKAATKPANAAATTTTTRTTDSNDQANNPTTTTGDRMDAWREKLQHLGLLDRGEQEMYLKEITGTGTFLGADGRVTQANAKAQQQAAAAAVAAAQMTNSSAADNDVLEVLNPTVDSIALNQALDPEVEALLYGDDVDFDAFEDLNDEFVLDAAAEKEPEPQPGYEVTAASSSDGVFDFDLHIQRLMEKARLESQGDSATAGGGGAAAGGDDRGDATFFSNARAFADKDDEWDQPLDKRHYQDILEECEEVETLVTVTPGVVSALNPEEERALCEKFHETLLEYDEDSDDDYAYAMQQPNEAQDENHPAPLARPLEGDKVVEDALDEYLREKEDDVFMQGHPGKNPGSGFAVLRHVDEKEQGDEQDQKEKREPVQQVLQRAKDELAQPVNAPPAEEILIDGQSYFSERPRNPWDCESILSTYSNLDNRPSVVGVGGGSKRRHRQRQRKAQQHQQQFEEADEEEDADQIRLSSKTGLPLAQGYDEDEDDEEEDTLAEGSVMSVNKGVARNRTETSEEKRARKAAMKRERQVARIQKKVTKQIFSEEFARRATVVEIGGGDAGAGQTVFRY